MGISLLGGLGVVLLGSWLGRGLDLDLSQSVHNGIHAPHASHGTHATPAPARLGRRIWLRLYC